MHDAASSGLSVTTTRSAFKRARANAWYPSIAETALTLCSALLLILSFPNFDLWFLAWVSLVPLLIILARRPTDTSAFILGWLWGTLFFYGTCYWLTYSMIRYGHIPTGIAYALLLIPVVLVALFPALSCLVFARLLARWGTLALFAAPVVWASFEWARLRLTGQLWNASGYSQAYVPVLIQTARWGGVYAVSFLIVLSNGVLAYLFLERNKRALIVSAMIMLAMVTVIFVSARSVDVPMSSALSWPQAVVVAVQPNVPMEPVTGRTAMESLIERHILLSTTALQNWERNGQVDNALSFDSNNNSLASRQAIPRLVIWPESPMNFAYGSDPQLRDRITHFARENRTSLLFNSLESAPEGGDYNSALMVNEEGRLVAQYDKIRLMPFGEYVPLPGWVPGSNVIAPLVGGFKAGTNYSLMPLGQARAGVFICFESAFPSIARTFTNEGAGVLINISNDGYLGPTPVMRQHLANAIFRAVENDRPLLRVTNTGLTAYIPGDGKLKDLTDGFQPAVRIWAVNENSAKPFYTKHGDLFVGLCAFITLVILAAAIPSGGPLARKSAN
jgi:apolipoprotein N-acyltransferase